MQTETKKLTLGELTRGDYFEFLPPSYFTGKAFIVLNSISDSVTNVQPAFKKTDQQIGAPNNTPVRQLTAEEVKAKEILPPPVKELTLGDLKKGQHFTFISDKEHDRPAFRIIKKEEPIVICNYSFIFSDLSFEFNSNLPVRLLTDAELAAKKLLPPPAPEDKNPPLPAEPTMLMDLKVGDLFIFISKDIDKSCVDLVMRAVSKNELEVKCEEAFSLNKKSLWYHGKNQVRKLTEKEIFDQKIEPVNQSLPPQAQLLQTAKLLQKRLEQLINATPSGSVRNKLTQENIDALLVIQLADAEQLTISLLEAYAEKTINHILNTGGTLKQMRDELKEVKEKILLLLDEVEREPQDLKKFTRQELSSEYAKEKTLEKYIKILEGGTA